MRRKQVDITDAILAQIEQVTGTTVDADHIVVFEAAAASTRPISKMGSLYNGARMSRTMLTDMAEALNSGSESVPLHTMHQQSYEIPKGRVFQASVVDEIDGSATLKTMFYLPLMERELIEKINLSILDEVSVGVKSTQALCSKCGFDYFGEDAGFENLFSQTCDNEHTLNGEDVHLKLVGLDKWLELSLVSRGASDKPKILSRAKQLVSQDEYDRMAASGKPVEALFLFTSMATETPNMPKSKETVVEPVEFDAEAAVEALTASITEISEQLATLTAPRVEEVEAETEDTQARLDEALARITELEAAAETPEVEVEVEIKPEIDLPVGGVTASAISDVSTLKASSAGRAVAFKTNR